MARHLYCSPLFKFSLKYCENNFDSVFILSAKYGVLSLDDEITTYEKTLNTMSILERKEWTIMVKKQILERKLKGEFWFFTGLKYNEFLKGKKPLKGMPLGKRLQWFKNKNKNIGLGLI